jgi:pyruvate ferredoxin oxidoreductase gamma subunit
MLGVVSREVLASAVREELGPLGASAVAQNLELALGTFESFAAREGCVAEADDAASTPSGAASSGAPEWVDVPFEPAATSAPDIHGSLTSVRVRTGLWRTVRPVIDYERCRRCHWVCSTLCPDAAISVRADQAPEIDYDHCKGCNICVAVCPSHAIRSVPEALARREEVEPT